MGGAYEDDLFTVQKEITKLLYLKQSTVATVKIGPFLDSTDGVTAEDGLTIEDSDVRLSKNGGNMAAKTEATNATHDELGYYDCPLDATDTNTLGRLQLMVSEAGALPVWHDYIVLDEDMYDLLVGSGMVEGTITMQDALRLILAVCAGKSSGGGTATLIFRDTGDAADRITATVDTNGNRTAVTTVVT